jgi:beta-lactamase regulating signal transducer with metallopeptidase domain
MGMPANVAPLIDSLGWALLHSLWQVALIGALVFVGLRIVPHHNARLRFFLAYFGLAGTLVAFMATWTIGYLIVDAAPASATALQASGFDRLVAVLGQTTWAVAAAWALGFGWLGVRYAKALRDTYRLRAHGISAIPRMWESRFEIWLERLGADRCARILQSSRITTPLTIGALKPIVLVPTGFFLRMPMEQAEAILIHEIAHICRQDYLLGLIQAMICNVFFFHPAIAYISRQIDIEREHACDARVVQETGKTAPLAQGLSQIALESCDMLPGFAMAADACKSPVIDRINRLRAKPFRRENNGAVPAGAVSLVLAGCLTIAMAADASFTVGSGKENAQHDDTTIEPLAEIALASPAENLPQAASQAPPAGSRRALPVPEEAFAEHQTEIEDWAIEFHASSAPTNVQPARRAPKAHNRLRLASTVNQGAALQAAVFTSIAETVEEECEEKAETVTDQIEARMEVMAEHHIEALEAAEVTRIAFNFDEMREAADRQAERAAEQIDNLADRVQALRIRYSDSEIQFPETELEFDDMPAPEVKIEWNGHHHGLIIENAADRPVFTISYNAQPRGIEFQVAFRTTAIVAS